MLLWKCHLFHVYRILEILIFLIVPTAINNLSLLFSNHMHVLGLISVLDKNMVLTLSCKTHARK